MEKAKTDLQTKLLWTLITIIVLMAGGNISYVINRNDKDIIIVQKLSEIKLQVKDLHYQNNDIYQNMIVPAFDLSTKNEKEILLLKKALSSMDSNQKVTNYNVIRIFDWVRKNKGLSFAD